MSTEQQVDTVVTLTPSALEAHREALALIQRAHAWAQGADISYEEMMAEDGQAGLRIVGERRAKAQEMELSYYRSFAHVLTMSQGWDGPLVVTRDTEACMFWRHPKSSYCGGLIFHRDLSLSKRGEPLTIGTWSLHT